MAHRAALYRVKVRPRGEPSAQGELLGDIDEEGTNLITVLHEFAADLHESNADESRSVRCVARTIQGNDELRLKFRHGQNGLAADLFDPEGNHKAHQDPQDNHLVTCGALFELPPAQRLGWLALHNNHGRGIAGLLKRGITSRFRQRFQDLILEIDPFVDESVFRRAVEEDLVDKVTLVRHERPEDRAATEKWVRSGEIGRLELEITSKGGNGRLVTRLLRRFLDNPEKAKEAIVTFEGITFDEAKVEVDLPDGGTKTFNIERLDSGHPITVDLEGLIPGEGGEPTDESLFAALRSTVQNRS